MLQDGLGGFLLLVGRIAVLAENALDVDAELARTFSRPVFEDHVAGVRDAALGGGSAGGDVRAVEDGVAEGFELGEGGGFDGGFGEGGSCHLIRSGFSSS